MRIVSDTAKAPEVERALSKDVSRPVLTAAYLDTETSTLAATDSYKLVVIPVELDEGDVSGPIPAEALKEQRKASKAARCPAPLMAGPDEVTLAGPGGTRTWPRTDVGQFPNVAQLVPTKFSRFRIGLNAKLLLDLAQALGNESVVLEFAMEANKAEGDDTGAFPAPLRPMRVTAHTGAGDSYGILMPVRVPT